MVHYSDWESSNAMVAERLKDILRGIAYRHLIINERKPAWLWFWASVCVQVLCVQTVRCVPALISVHLGIARIRVLRSTGGSH